MLNKNPLPPHPSLSAASPFHQQEITGLRIVRTNEWKSLDSFGAEGRFQPAEGQISPEGLLRDKYLCKVLRQPSLSQVAKQAKRLGSFHCRTTWSSPQSHDDDKMLPLLLPRYQRILVGIVLYICPLKKRKI